MTTPDEKTFATLTKLFEEEFGPIGDRQVLYVHAPGRSCLLYTSPSPRD